MRRVITFMTLLFLFIGLTACDTSVDIPNNQNNTPPIIEEPVIEEPVIEEPVIEDPVIEDPIIKDVIFEDSFYTSRDEVALYIATYHKLPSNYMTKAQAVGGISSYWTLENLASIGGDVFQNRENLLPKKEGRTYTELDINYQGTSSRGKERIVYSNDWLIFYTSDHYGSFVLYDEVTGTWNSY